MTIVDTDILIDAGRGDKRAISCLREIEAQSALGVSAISAMELLVGCRNSSELRQIERFLTRFQIVKVSEDICDRAVQLLRQYCLSHGLQIPDALIAATAIHCGAPFISKNVRHFRFIAGLRTLEYPRLAAPD
jgi:predicted nucleic acid-binding protein